MLKLMIPALCLVSSVSAFASTDSVTAHISNYINVVCPQSGAQTEIVSQVLEATKNGALRVESSAVASSLDLAQLEIVRDAQGNQMISVQSLADNCSEELAVVNLTCGDHWFQVELSVDLTSNHATLELGGDSVGGGSEVFGRVVYIKPAPGGVSFEVVTQGGTYQVTRANKSWSVTHNNTALGLCRSK